MEEIYPLKEFTYHGALVSEEGVKVIFRENSTGEVLISVAGYGGDGYSERYPENYTLKEVVEAHNFAKTTPSEFKQITYKQALEKQLNMLKEKCDGENKVVYHLGQKGEEELIFDMTDFLHKLNRDI